MTDSLKTADLEKMDGKSLDIAVQRRLELKLLLPGVFTETTGQDGQPVETIDFERLKAELGTFSDVYEGRRERDLPPKFWTPSLALYNDLRRGVL